MQNSKNPPAGHWPQDVDALRAGLEHAKKHRARSEAGAREALDNWIEAETALAHGGKMLKHDTIETVGPGRVDHLWRLYCGEQEGAERAAEVVHHVAELLARAENAPSVAPAAGEGAAGNRGPRVSVRLTRAQVNGLIATIGERCDALHARRVALPESAESRAAGMLDSLTFWTGIESALKRADLDTADDRETLRGARLLMGEIVTKAAENVPPSERLRAITAIARNVAGMLHAMHEHTAAPAAGDSMREQAINGLEEDEDPAGPVTDDERSNGPRRSPDRDNSDDR